MQHICSHRTHKHIEKTLRKVFLICLGGCLGAPLRWTTSLLISFLSCTHHTVMICTEKAFYTYHPLSHYIAHISGTSCQCSPGIPHLRLAKKQRRKESFFSKVEEYFLLFKVQFSSPSRLHLSLATHSCKLELNVLYIIHTLKGNAYVHTNLSCSFSSLSLQIVLENAVRHEMALLTPSSQMCLAWNSCWPWHMNSWEKGVGGYGDYEWEQLTQVSQLCCFHLHSTMH